jgi:hypothetical protein
MLKSFAQKGMASVVHGNCGREPRNATRVDLVERICALAGINGAYHDFNTCHLQEVLQEREDICLGRSTLDRLLKQQSVRRSTRRQAIKRRRRDRKAAEGMLLQIDGSTHHWLEDRAPRMCLVGAIDDATGRVLFLCFRPTEDQAGYLALMQEIACRYGLPMAYYHDRHTILLSPKKATIEDELAGRAPMSQLQRVLHELGVESIAANSPQAKGRIERLWGTLQDRLIKELRLASINTREEANAFLPTFMQAYNERFAKRATDPEDVWVPLPENLDLNYYFSTRQERTVRKDHTLEWRGRILQLATSPLKANLAGRRINVHINCNGQILCYYGKKPLSFKVVDADARTQKTATEPKSKPTRDAEQLKPSRRKQMAYLHTGL